MRSLTIKGIPDDLLDRLRSLAERERRSLTQQVLVLLERGVETSDIERSPASPDQIAAWRRLAGEWLSDRPVEDEVGDVYAARSQGRSVNL